MKQKKVILLLAVVLIAGAVAGYLLVRKDTAKQITSNVVTFSTDKPDEKKPDKATYQWRGKPTEPKYIKLPAITTEGFLQNVGVDQNKQIAVPNNIHVAGWFNQMALPGDKGLSIIDGHVTGRVNDGIFKDLEKLKKDDTFTIEFGNGSSKEFKMVESVDTPVAESAAVLFSQDPAIEKQVNLITCSGKFDKKLNGYPNRLIIIATAL